jgi:hypothetical protein
MTEQRLIKRKKIECYKVKKSDLTSRFMRLACTKGRVDGKAQQTAGLP